MTELNSRPIALITGASSGIGAAYASHLAREGFDLVITARREDRLCDLAQRLEQTRGVRVEVLVADLASTNDVERLAARIAAMDRIDLLVNNAGFGTSALFAGVGLQSQLDMVHVHIVATVRLTRAALDRMLPAQSGSIVNVSSIAGWIVRSGNASYSATKSFLTTFTEALGFELAGTGVRIQALCPGFTYTEFHDTPEYANFDRGRFPRFLWMTAEDVVAQSLRGLESGPVVLVPGRMNRLLVAVARTRLGRWLVRRKAFALRTREE